MDRGGFYAGARHPRPRRARPVYGVKLWDDPGTWEGHRAGTPPVVPEGTRVVVAGAGARTWQPHSIPGRPGIYLCSPELVRPVVVAAVDLLVKPAEKIPELGLEWVWGLDRRGVEALDRCYGPSLAEAVGGLTATVRQATAEVVAGAAELAGTPSLSALVLGEVTGAVAAVMVAPLVVHLRLGAELLEVVSMLLPAGDVRAWASEGLAKDWAEQTVTHGLEDYLEPWSGLVSVAAGAWLFALAAAPGPPGREERSPVDAGIDEVELRYPGIPRSDEPVTDLQRQGPRAGIPSVQGPGPSTQPAAGRDVDRGRRGEHRGGGFGDQQDPDAYWSAIPGTERWQDASAQPQREGEVVVGRVLAGKDPAEAPGGHREHLPWGAR